jgi:hypothetical protein
MSVVVTIKGRPFRIPQRKEQSWGDEVTNWAVTISKAVDDLTVAGDIKLITVTVNNNQVAPIAVPNLKFDTVVTRHAIVDYAVYRIKGADELSQAGQLYLTYKSTAGTWEIADNTVGDAGIVFTITPQGQVQYTTTDLTDVGTYTGKCSFRGRAFPV